MSFPTQGLAKHAKIVCFNFITHLKPSNGAPPFNAPAQLFTHPLDECPFLLRTASSTT